MKSRKTLSLVAIYSLNYSSFQYEIFKVLVLSLSQRIVLYISFNQIFNELKRQLQRKYLSLEKSSLIIFWRGKKIVIQYSLTKLIYFNPYLICFPFKCAEICRSNKSIEISSKKIIDPYVLALERYQTENNTINIINVNMNSEKSQTIKTQPA